MIKEYKTIKETAGPLMLVKHRCLTTRWAGGASKTAK